MKSNIGDRDILLRWGIAILLLAAAYWQRSWILLLASAFVVYEVYAGWCIFYSLIGKCTCRGTSQ